MAGAGIFRYRQALTQRVLLEDWLQMQWQVIDFPGQPDVMLDYAQVWQAADKVVYSRTLETPATARTRVERNFDPGAVRELKAAASAELSVGGAELAAQALGAGLVDECRLFLSPVVVGGGTRAFPDGLSLRLELVDERRFGNGVVHLRYRTSEEEP